MRYLLLIHFFGAILISVTSNCPTNCDCSLSIGSVHCQAAELNEFPPNIDSSTTSLHLQFNHIPTLTLFWTGGGKNAPPGRYFEKKLTHFGPKAQRGSDFYFLLVLQVLAKKVGQIGVVIRKYFDFVEGSSQFSIQISENSGKRWK